VPGVLLCALLLDCAATTAPELAPSTTPIPSGSMPEPTPIASGESEAIAAAQHLVTDDAASVWATMEGTYGDVFGAMAHRPFAEIQPALTGAKQERLVWGVQFKVSMEICGPQGSTCETRDGLRTIVIGYFSGKVLDQSAYGPSPGDPLPTPDPL
jgi:hypothetical protein